MIHLDTSFLIRALQKGTDEDRMLRRWLGQDTELGISAVCWTEFLCGPLGVEDVDHAGTLFGEPEPFLADDSARAARLFNESGRRRGTLVDCMVAATALRLAAALATSNPSDFGRFASAGLSVVTA